MKFPVQITIHDDERYFEGADWVSKENTYHKFCSYCGSIIHEDFYEYLNHPKCFIELVDQSFYITVNRSMYKYTIKHLMEIEDTKTFNTMLELINSKVRFNLKDKL